jgi:hypothetical protein
MHYGKLLRTERAINVYKKTRSKHLGQTLMEVNIDKIPLDKLIEIIIANPDDPLLLNVYILKADEIKKLNEFLDNKIIPDFKLYAYYLECYGIYDSEK